jgi:hypothetical protein
MEDKLKACTERGMRNLTEIDLSNGNSRKI